jgi:hypothetical protein
LQICLQFDIADHEIETLRTGFIEWVEHYEAYVVAPLPMHQCN